MSGGQTEIEATENLNLINKFNNTNFIMSYSYGRALQQSALKFWSKDTKNIKGTQKVFNHRAMMKYKSSWKQNEEYPNLKFPIEVKWTGREPMVVESQEMLDRHIARCKKHQATRKE